MRDERVHSVDERGFHDALPEQVVLEQWRNLAPVLRGPTVTLRELRLQDAPALLTVVPGEDLLPLMSPPPATIESYERLVLWAREQRQAGQGVCLGLVPAPQNVPIGVFYVRQTEPNFATAEWGFALSPAFWNDGLFLTAAPLVVDFVFDVLGSRRLEARTLVHHGRRSSALAKIGAVQEAVMRRSIFRDGEYVDQILWAILADDWRTLRPRRVH